MVAPNNPLNFVGLGRVAFASGDTQKGIELFNRAIAMMTVKGSVIDKNTQQLVYIKAAEVMIQSDRKDLVKAFEYIQAAQKLNDKNPEIYIQWGDLLLENESMNRADVIDQYEKAYELDPKYTRAIQRQGHSQSLC